MKRDLRSVCLQDVPTNLRRAPNKVIFVLEHSVWLTLVPTKPAKQGKSVVRRMVLVSNPAREFPARLENTAWMVLVFPTHVHPLLAKHQSIVMQVIPKTQLANPIHARVTKLVDTVVCVLLANHIASTILASS